MESVKNCLRVEIRRYCKECEIKASVRHALEYSQKFPCEADKKNHSNLSPGRGAFLCLKVKYLFLEHV